MKLLFDENLSPRLVGVLASEYPESKHAAQVGLLAADDRKIWHHARDHGFTIVSKDTDFRERSLVEGFPPKVIWLDVGNAGTGANRGTAAPRASARAGVRGADGVLVPHSLSRTGSILTDAPLGAGCSRLRLLLDPRHRGIGVPGLVAAACPIRTAVER